MISIIPFRHKNIKEPSRRWSSLLQPLSSPWLSPLPILSVSPVRNSQERQPWLLRNYPWGGHWRKAKGKSLWCQQNILSRKCTKFILIILLLRATASAKSKRREYAQRQRSRGARTRARVANAKNYLVSDMADRMPRSRMQEWLNTFKYLLFSIFVTLSNLPHFGNIHFYVGQHEQ